jgi:Tol biopolymer transport system component
MRASAQLLRVLAAAAAVVALSACSGGDENEETGVRAAPQEGARLVAVRNLPGKPPTLNPPRFDLVTMNEDGSDQRVLVHTPMRGDITLLRLSDPAWSPDARWIYFTGVVEERETARFNYYVADIFAVRPDGGELRRLTNSGDASFAVPSPDGRKLLYARLERRDAFPPTVGLWLMDANGGEQQRLLDTRRGWIDVPGSWAPDGRTIAFTRCRPAQPGPRGQIPNTCAVQIVSSVSSDVRQIADRARSPVYSPDGQRLAFLTDRDEHGSHRTGSDEVAFANELYVMEADGRRPIRLTHTEELDEEAASWSPDGERIAYGREGPASFVHQVMVVNADGSCPTRIAGNGSVTNARDIRDYDQPVWRPGRITGERAELDCKGDD